MTRSAISPRLAIRIFLNMSDGLDGEQPFAVLHRLAVLDVGADDLAVVLRRDLVHQLHRFDDAEHLILLDAIADLHERRGSWLGRPIERTDNRRLHDGQLYGLVQIDAGRPT